MTALPESLFTARADVTLPLTEPAYTGKNIRFVSLPSEVFMHDIGSSAKPWDCHL